MATLSPEQSASISKTISNIQSSLNTLSQAKSAGMNITSSSSVQDAQKYLSGKSSSSTVSPTTSAGAVNSKGELVDSSGKVIGMANPADRYSPQAKQAVEPIVQNSTQGLTQNVNTAQPSPQTANANPFTAPTVPYEQAIQNLRSSGGFSGSRLAEMESSLADTYRKAGMALNQSGVPAPQSAGAGIGGAQTATTAFTQPQEGASKMTFAEELDPQISNFITQFDDFMSPMKQRVSLVEEYQNLSKNLGLEQINADLINTKKIIEGTEDSIREEITAAGGTATDSQVMAFANARNKQLIKNYNYLLDARNGINTQLNTLMDLSIQDRQMAEAEFDRKINFAFKVAEFKERATTNAREGLRWAIENGGGAEILKNPYDTQLAEKTLGMPKGSLAGIVSQQQKDAELARRKAEADISNIYSQISDRNKTTQDAIKVKQRIENAAVKADIVLSNVNQALGSVGGVTSGFFGGLSKNIPGTSAYNLNKTITTIKANIGFQELQSMREASPTGGALGSIAVQELEALQSTLGSLDIGQSPEQLKANLNAVKTHYTNWLNTVGYEVEPDGTIIQIIPE